MHEHVHGHDSAHASGHDDSAHEHSHGGVGKYIAVFVALCILTAISFAVATFMMGPEADGATQLVGRIMMITVSCCKALLVMLFFMHLLWEANWKYVLTIPASIMSIFLMLMLFPDVLDRTRQYAEERWLYAATPEDPEAEGHAPESPHTGATAPTDHR